MIITDWKIYTPDKRFHVFINIETDVGVNGWGSAYSEKGQVLGALAWLKRFVIGENPLEIERVTERLHQITFWLGRGGAMTHAISAINLALWDATGKILKQPVHVLLGGRQRMSVPAYGSILFRPLQSLAERIQTMRERGFRTMKLGWDPFCHGTVADDERLVAAARKYAGDEVTLMIDAGGSSPHWHLRWKDALERSRMLRTYGIYWFEEPLAPDDIDGYARLTEFSEIRIAHGEVLTRRQSFVPYFERRAMDIVQPDVTKVGGLSEMRRIAWMADERGIEVVPHGWNTAVGVAADIQFVSTLPGRSFVEFNVGNPLVEEVLEKPFELDTAGELLVSDAPGLGIDICTEKLEQLESTGFASETWTWDEE